MLQTAKSQSLKSIARVNTTSLGVSSRSVKSDDVRKETNPRTESRQVSWVSTFRVLRRQTQRHITISRTIQRRSYRNSDSSVAALEIAIFALSMTQLKLSSNSPRWVSHVTARSNPFTMK